MGTSPVGLKTKNHRAGNGQQRFNSQTDQSKSEAAVRQPPVEGPPLLEALCSMPRDDREDLACAIVNFIVCELLKWM
jgi:hypothetical protein